MSAATSGAALSTIPPHIAVLMRATYCSVLALYVCERSRTKELARLLDDVEPHKVTDQSTIGECWIAFQESKGG
jgi:hypothetical protein